MPQVHNGKTYYTQEELDARFEIFLQKSTDEMWGKLEKDQNKRERSNLVTV